MSGFQLDTSGEVYTDPPLQIGNGNTLRYWKFENLSPFEQGYVEAMFESLHGRLCGASVITSPGVGTRRVDPKPTGRGGCSRRAVAMEGASFLCGQHAKNPPTVLRKADGKQRSSAKPVPTAFSALARETLAAIKKDCGIWQDLFAGEQTAAQGHRLWSLRQSGFPGDHPTFEAFRSAFPPLTPNLNDAGKVVFSPPHPDPQKSRSPNPCKMEEGS